MTWAWREHTQCRQSIRYIWCIICQTNQFSALPLRFLLNSKFWSIGLFWPPRKQKKKFQSPWMSRYLAIYKGSQRKPKKPLIFHDFQSTVSPTVFIKSVHVIHQNNRLFLWNSHIFRFLQNFQFYRVSSEICVLDI